MNMQPVSQPRHFTPEQVAAEQAAFMRKVYLFMALGLATTGGVSVAVASSDALLEVFVGNRNVFYGLLIAELVMVFTFAFLAKKLSAIGAGALFFLYAIMNGLTFSVIFLVYTRESIAQTFFITGGTFGACSAYGYVTKRDLNGVGYFAMMGLFGLIIASVVNLFMRAPQLQWICTCVGVVVFTLLTAYDTQKIRQMNVIGNAGTDEDHKEAIHGALILYLDFINLFLYLLRLFGRRR